MLPIRKLFSADDHLLLAGGTGFVGLSILSWLASRPLEERPKITLVARHPELIWQFMPGIAGHLDIELHSADVCVDPLPDADFDYVVHAATSSGPDVAANPSAAVLHIARSADRILEYSMRINTKGILLLSSGAVYGPLPTELETYPEDFMISPDCQEMAGAYGNAKRYAEQLACCLARQYQLPVKTARCFSFVGPYLKLDGQLAIGNFIRDALWHDTISIQGDGSAIRSYLASDDLAEWLLTILIHGALCHPYHVGSDVAIKLSDLAQLVADTLCPGKPIQILGTNTSATRSRYVPEVSRARNELGLHPRTSLVEAIRRTARWALDEYQTQ